MPKSQIAGALIISIVSIGLVKFMSCTLRTIISQLRENCFPRVLALLFVLSNHLKHWQNNSLTHLLLRAIFGVSVSLGMCVYQFHVGIVSFRMSLCIRLVNLDYFFLFELSKMKTKNSTN